MVKHIILISAIFIITGCATPIQPNQVALAVNSVPKGAQISTDGKSFGIAPTLTWTLDKPTDFSVKTNLITATWPSGATASTRVKILRSGEKFTYVFQRPDVPGADIDFRYAQQIENEGRQKEGESSAGLMMLFLGAATAGYTSGNGGSISNSYKSSPYDRGVTCATSTIGLNPVTTCRPD